jgi:hypothetical protein
MIGSSKLHQPGWLSGALHFIIIALALQAESAEVWPYALLAMAVVSFFAWAANYRRYRQIHDLPTSKVASAAQGYVELAGHAELVTGETITSQLSGTTCCWYSYEIQEKGAKDNWQTVDSGRSVRHFNLVDDTGQCAISPDGAEVLTNDHKSWQEGNRRYSEWMLMPKDVLYAIGEFRTGQAIVSAAGDENAEAGALLVEWKKDQKKLLERFDLDRDGKIDMKEWELARLQARREARKNAPGPASHPIEGMHMLRKPKDGRLFLLANELPDKLGARYRIWSWVHLVIFIGAGCASLLML